jgi:hypothetical protein
MNKSDPTIRLTEAVSSDPGALAEIQKRGEMQRAKHGKANFDVLPG